MGGLRVFNMGGCNNINKNVVYLMLFVTIF